MLRTRLSEALKDSMRAKNERVTHTVRLIMAKLKDADIAARPKGITAIPDDEILQVMRDMRAHNIDQCYSRINAANAASLASHQRMGAHLLGRIGLLRWGPWLWAPRLRLRPLRPAHAARLEVVLPTL